MTWGSLGMFSFTRPAEGSILADEDVEAYVARVFPTQGPNTEALPEAPNLDFITGIEESIAQHTQECLKR